jgi:hypothetical protein
MDVDRRSLMKGMVAGGVFMAFGAPRWAHGEASLPAGRRCALLLCNGSDAAFERGARVVAARTGAAPLEIVKLENGLLTETAALIERIERGPDARWIAFLDDASAAVFQELVRSAGGRLLSRGSHASSDDGSVRFRHVWMTAAPMWSAGALLASHLAQSGSSYSIQESFLDQTPAARPGRECQDFLRRSDDWVECLGQAVTASAFGLGAGRDLPADLAAVHASHRGESRRPAVRRFTSFVADL